MNSIRILKEEMDKQAGIGSALKTGLKYMYSPFGVPEEIIRKSIKRATSGRKLLGGEQKGLDLIYNAVAKKDVNAIAELGKLKSLKLEPKKRFEFKSGRKKKVNELRKLKNEIRAVEKGVKSSDRRAAANVLYRLGILGGATGGTTFGIGKAVDYGKKKKANRLENLISNI